MSNLTPNLELALQPLWPSPKNRWRKQRGGWAFARCWKFTSELFSTSRDWLETTLRSPAIHGLLAQWAESKSGSPCIRALPPAAVRDCVKLAENRDFDKKGKQS
jgi:hypothetical protein